MQTYIHAYKQNITEIFLPSLHSLTLCPNLDNLSTVQPLLNSHPWEMDSGRLKGAGHLAEVKTIEKLAHWDFEYWLPNSGDHLIGGSTVFI